MCFIVVNQKYEAEIMTEYVIRGNTAVLKCSIPSFVADFVQVESWLSEDGMVYHTPSRSDGQEVYGNDEVEYWLPIMSLAGCLTIVKLKLLMNNRSQPTNWIVIKLICWSCLSCGYVLCAQLTPPLFSYWKAVYPFYHFIKY